MNSLFKKICLVSIASFLVIMATAQVGIYTTIEPEAIGKEDYVTYRIVVENSTDIKQVSRPVFKNFDIVDGPVQETGMNNVNGHVTRFVSWVFTLKPRQAGRLSVDPVTATINGRQYKSNRVFVLVSKDAQTTRPNPFSQMDPFSQPKQAGNYGDYIFRKGENLADKVKQNMELKLELDKTSCFVGEPLMATYTLYTRLKSESKLTQNPSFNGFSVIDMQQSESTGYSQKKLNGKDYNAYTIRRAQLYALQPGDIEIESAELENNIQFIKEEYADRFSPGNSLFDDFSRSIIPAEAVINQTVPLKSTALKVHVKPLPEENKPTGFNGAVGHFLVDATMQKDSFSTDESGKIAVTISGGGNMQLLTAPDIAWPSGIESFEPTVTDNMSKLTVPVSGSKVFEYSFAAEKPGIFTLPPITFSFFDPAKAEYRTVSTKPIRFTVLKGTGKSALLNTGITNNGKLSFINRIFHHRWWIVVFVAFLVICSLVVWVLRDKRKQDKKQAMTVPEVVQDAHSSQLEEALAESHQHPLAETEKCLQQEDCNTFYSSLNHELKAFLSRRFSIDASSLNANTISAMLDANGIDNSVSLRLQQLMREIEWQLYTPFERNEKMNERYHETMEIIQQIHAHNIRHR